MFPPPCPLWDCSFATAAGLVSSPDGKVIVFDGVCFLCSRSVAFVLARDRQKQFRFATLQSTSGRALLIRHGLDPEDPDSFLLADGAAGYENSDAIIRVVTALGGAWRREACMVPSPEMQGRFLE